MSIRYLKIASLVFVGMTSAVLAAPRVEGTTLVMTSRAEYPKDRTIEVIPARVEDIKEVVYGDWSGEPRRMKVKQVQKVLSRSTELKTEQGHVKAVGTTYMLIPDISEQIDPKDADIGPGFMWSHLETEMIMVNTVDAYKEGKFIGREIEAGWPGVARTFGQDSHETRDAARTR